MQQRRKRSKGKLKIQNQGLLASGSPTGEPLASQCIFTKPTGKPEACRLCNLASGSPTGERLASTTRSCAFWPFSQHIKRESWIFWRGGGKHTTWDISRAHFGVWRAWRTLGKLGIQVGSLERFELSSFVVVYLLPSSSYLFNELLHSFRVCFIYIYV